MGVCSRPGAVPGSSQACRTPATGLLAWNPSASHHPRLRHLRVVTRFPHLSPIPPATRSGEGHPGRRSQRPCHAGKRQRQPRGLGGGGGRGGGEAEGGCPVPARASHPPPAGHPQAVAPGAGEGPVPPPWGRGTGGTRPGPQIRALRAAAIFKGLKGLLSLETPAPHNAGLFPPGDVISSGGNVSGGGGRGAHRLLPGLGLPRSIWLPWPSWGTGSVPSGNLSAGGWRAFSLLLPTPGQCTSGAGTGPPPGPRLGLPSPGKCE